MDSQEKIHALVLPHDWKLPLTSADIEKGVIHI